MNRKKESYDRIAVGERIRQKRTLIGLSQDELAEQIDRAPKYISDIEAQKKVLDNKKKELQNKKDEINKINEENKVKIEKLNKLKAEQQVEVDKLKEEIIRVVTEHPFCVTDCIEQANQMSVDNMVSRYIKLYSSILGGE